MKVFQTLWRAVRVSGFSLASIETVLGGSQVGKAAIAAGAVGVVEAVYRVAVPVKDQSKIGQLFSAVRVAYKQLAVAVPAVEAAAKPAVAAPVATEVAHVAEVPAPVEPAPVIHEVAPEAAPPA